MTDSHGLFIFFCLLLYFPFVVGILAADQIKEREDDLADARHNRRVAQETYVEFYP